jgi:acetyl-CoA carboxylase biotin carboxyl carrier protein
MKGAPSPSDPPLAREEALALARELLQRLRDPAVRELEVRQGDVRVMVTKDGPPPPAARQWHAPDEAPAAAPPAQTPAARPAATKEAAKAITAPLTGIFYRSPSPQAPPFVQVGTVVSPGDVIGLIEAMKLFNEVRSTMAGRVRRLVAENGQLVRAHQPILELE